MCNQVIINRGEKEIGTPREFQNHFGFLPVGRYIYTSPNEMDSCLCQRDLEKTFKKHKIEYRFIDGDYFVGKLDELKD